MGFSISWFAVPEAHAAQFLEKLGLSPTGASEEEPESLISTLSLETPYRVIWYNSYDCPFLTPALLASISSQYDVLVCRVEEHVMASSAELWSGGKRKWWLAHHWQQGP